MNLDKAIKELKDENEQCYEQCDGCCSEVINNVCTCRDATLLSELEQYRAIGTVEECREAGERQSGKKPIKTPDCSDCKKECNKNCISFDYGETYLCPTCRKNTIFNSEYDVFYKHCLNCGQKLDWSE